MDILRPDDNLTMTEKDHYSSVRNLALWLSALVCAAAIANLVEPYSLFVSDIPITLYVGGELWSQSLSSFLSGDRLAIIAILSFEQMLWLAVLLQVWLLCRLYRQNKVFTVKNARHFFYIGCLLLGLFLYETLLATIVGAYLYSRDILPQLPDWQGHAMLKTGYLVPGLFLILVAKIMEHAARLQEESELTI
ncbi:hypothetical protein HMF8227_02269 [Saliniradius amylolyticus]|uniref:DUF2975 domain-containing protein n=1 Tax=Saliniradius amylolyticus TaxID=2183582 RepID=A0A2S2E5B6_9ALTE|nr:DUF2975 domain-containing protein [Saliniradius amylolyticus]AWL12722.1 hypothetical protein HMF8227_02269 [Saliniradius amylolyticus]